MAQQKRSIGRILEFALIFGIVYFGSTYVTQWFFPAQTPETRGVSIAMQDDAIRRGQHPIVTIRNGTEHELRPPNTCPMPPFEVWRIVEEGGAQARMPLLTTETAVPCKPLEPIPAGGTVQADLTPWKYSLFDQVGTYELHLPIDLPDGGTGTGAVVHTLTTHFELYEPGIVVRLFRGLVTKPILFALVSIASVLPGHSLGWAIILVTLLVKLILFIPTQHALEGQRKMQILQPQLEAIRQKHKGDPAKMQEETMRIWRENKINPFQSILPMLLQIPVLFGLFFVIRDGSTLETSREFLYPLHHDLSWTLDHMFFGMDLTKVNWIFPPVLVALQFLQMKLTFMVAKRKAAHKPSADTSATDMQQKIMLYALPLMIGYFAITMPVAVSLYWAVSTLFAIGQQMVVNREHMVRHGKHVEIVE
jgi:YidC/Oxa1 family membrane protein insertase